MVFIFFFCIQNATGSVCVMLTFLASKIKKRMQRFFSEHAVLTLRMARKSCPEASVTKYQPTSCNIREERKPQVYTACASWVSCW